MTESINKLNSIFFLNIKISINILYKNNKFFN